MTRALRGIATFFKDAFKHAQFAYPHDVAVPFADLVVAEQIEAREGIVAIERFLGQCATETIRKRWADD